MIFSLYRALGTAAGPFVEAYLNRRLARGKEHPDRFGERHGHSGLPRPDGALVWFHAASVGESLSLLPLIERLRSERPALNILITTGTVTSARLMAERLPSGAIHQFIPVDRVAYVRRFFDHWKPDLVLWTESEFWPNLVLEPRRRNIPLVLINGRVSPKAFRGWKRVPWVIGKLLSGFSLCLGQTETDVKRLSDLGASPVRTVGNLKFAVPPLPAGDDDLERLRSEAGGRTVFLAASTHPGEEEILWQVHQKLVAQIPDLLTIIVPRHPERGLDIKRSLSSLGASVRCRSTAEPIDGAADVYIADTLGELGLFYRLAKLVFMGKSLVNMGGQNLLEAARLDCVIFHGPHMWNFTDIVDGMMEGKALIKVSGGNELAAALYKIHCDPQEQDRLASAAHAYAETKAGVLDAVLSELKPYLDTAEASHEKP